LLAREPGPALSQCAGAPACSLALDSDLQKALGSYTGRAPDPAVEQFLLHLAVCNTVVPTVGEDGKLTYQVRASLSRSGGAVGVQRRGWVGARQACAAAAAPMISQHEC
jgi:hypothetical protein